MAVHSIRPSHNNGTIDIHILKAHFPWSAWNNYLRASYLCAVLVWIFPVVVIAKFLLVENSKLTRFSDYGFKMNLSIQVSLSFTTLGRTFVLPDHGWRRTLESGIFISSHEESRKNGYREVKLRILRQTSKGRFPPLINPMKIIIP